MKEWYMLTVVGQDRPGIVARLTQALYDGGCNLGEASMMRLGGNFTIMLMVQLDGSAEALRELIMPGVREMQLREHVDRIEGALHQHLLPDVRITVFGADRAGIVAKVTQALANAGLNILNLESDVAGTPEQPIYIMHVEGQAQRGPEPLRAAVEAVARDGVQAHLQQIDTVIG